MSQTPTAAAPPSDPHASKRAQWAKGGGYSQTHQSARSLCQLASPTAKTMRELYAAIGSGSIEPAEALAIRARHQAGAGLAVHALHLTEHQSKHERAAMAAQGSRIDSRAERALSHLGALPHMAEATSRIAVGSLAATDAPEARVAKLIERRERKDWATCVRRDFGGALFSDPLLLSMLRIAAPADLPAALQMLLALSVLCACPRSARAALSFGARPDERFDFAAIGLTPAYRGRGAGPVPKSASLLGLALLSGGSGGLNIQAPNDFFTTDDAIVLCSAHIALGCCPDPDPARWLSLRPPGSPAPDADAMGLSLSRGLIRCARHFLSLGMDPVAKSCGPRSPLPQASASYSGIHPLRIQALEAIYAEGEARALARHLGDTLPDSPSARPGARL